MKQVMWLAALFVSACAGTGTATESPDAAVPATARAQACEGEAYRAFDFWLGEWTVTDEGGTLQGTNRITSEEGGCLLVERWTSASGGTGQSYNFYQPAKGSWRQVWVNAGSVIDYEGGPTETGGMHMEGTISYRNGTAFPFRGAWTVQADGSVRQEFAQYNPQSEAWEPWFVGIYRRAPAS